MTSLLVGCLETAVIYYCLITHRPDPRLGTCVDRRRSTRLALA